MPQDVFVRHVYGMSVREIDDLWSAKLDHIRAVGGVAVVSVHPRWISMSDPELRAAYRRLLERIASEDDLLATTPSGLEAALVASGPSP